MRVKLKATKTSLYKLVSLYAALPGMKKTDFTKYRRTFWLRWYDDYATYEACFTVCAGRPILTIERRKLDGDAPPTRTVYTITVDDLRSRGMTEENLSLSIS